ncbi:MAG: gluconate 2-dehydrogenase subunit 3 family protein [Novosphingobium sp.]|nr:gluconate 2-dehydrogenase subunit 3 family protein [Novosphingobium sp.]
MAHPAVNEWHRRDFLGAAALAALCFGLPEAALAVDRLPKKAVPRKRQRVLMRAVSDLVLPRTDTPGAGEVGTGDFVLLALAHGLGGSAEPVTASIRASLSPAIAPHLNSDGSLRHADWLEAELDRRAGGSFLNAGSGAAGLLSALDAQAYVRDMDGHPWRTIKTLILTGYYTSEAGASQELRFELVPGRWDPDLPVTAETRAFSSDWTAVDFG